MCGVYAIRPYKYVYDNCRGESYNIFAKNRWRNSRYTVNRVTPGYEVIDGIPS